MKSSIAKNSIGRSNWLNFYRKMYIIGFYSLEQLIEIYQDYELHRKDWEKSFYQYKNFEIGQGALLQVINEIQAGIIREENKSLWEK